MASAFEVFDVYLSKSAGKDCGRNCWLKHVGMRINAFRMVAARDRSAQGPAHPEAVEDFPAGSAENYRLSWPLEGLVGIRDPDLF